jgi:hypothetical protein
MNTLKRSSAEWFQEAQRCYLEQHQGCAWCGGSHRVFQTHADQHLTYSCSTCDFRVGFDKENDRYFLIPGENPSEINPATVLEI